MHNGFLKIKNEVSARRPALLEILNLHGKESLANYIKKSWQVPKAQPDSLFLKVLQSVTENIYGQDIAKRLIEQLEKKPLVSTVDHHGIWNHPIFVNSSTLYSISLKSEDLTVVFSTEGISLNNSCWAGNFLYHDKKLNLCRQSFFSDKEKTKAVLATPAIRREDIIEFNNKSQNSFKELIDRLGSWEGGSFSEQACHINHQLWQIVYPSAPKLIYIPLESLVSSYLLEILKSSSHVFSKIVLTKEGGDMWQKYFGGDHTFMFWGVSEKGRREIVKKLPDNTEELINSIKYKKIYPSGSLCFIILLFAGFSCAGGFNQTTWLARVKENFIKLLKSLPGVDSVIIEKINNVPTQNFCESSLAWLKMGDGYIQPSAVDLYFTGKDYYPMYTKLAETLTLEQSLDLAMPEIYRIVVPKNEQDSSINLAQLEKEIFDSFKLSAIIN